MTSSRIWSLTFMVMLGAAGCAATSGDDAVAGDVTDAKADTASSVAALAHRTQHDYEAIAYGGTYRNGDGWAQVVIGLETSALPAKVKTKYADLHQPHYDGFSASSFRLADRTKVYVLSRNDTTKDVYVEYFFYTSTGRLITSGYSMDDPQMYWN